MRSAEHDVHENQPTTAQVHMPYSLTSFLWKSNVKWLVFSYFLPHMQITVPVQPLCREAALPG